MPKLSDMPSEILCQISQQLSTTDLGNVRLTNKKYEAAIFKPFMREFFSKKQFMLTEPSLRALLDISQHPQFGREIKHVVLGLDHYRLYMAGNAPYSYKGTEYLMNTSAQLAFVNSGTARDMLALAIQNLPSLQVIDIRDFRSRTRTRDDGSFNSYGSTTVEQETGLAMDINLQGDGSSSSSSSSSSQTLLFWPSTVFNMVVQVISQAVGQGSHASIDIETVIRSNKWGLMDSAFSIPEFGRSRYITALQGMKKLHLCIDMDRTTFCGETLEDPRDSEGRRWMIKSHLQKFLCHTSNLEWLRLNFPQNPDYAQQKTFLCWLGLPKEVAFPLHFTAPLKRLDLGHVILGAEAFHKLFRRFEDTLEALSIWNSCIEATMQETKDKVNKWAQLFESLAELPRLKEVVVGRLRMPLYLYEINFVASNGEEGGKSVRYRGNDARGFLTRLAKRTVALWPELSSDSESEELDALDDDNDDDDEREHESNQNQE